jgi:hypothetical protein
MKEGFENSDMAHSVFHQVNLHKAVFDDVNLGEATFRNVNLGKATIRNANLGDLQIEDANIRGLTIFGFRIDELIEAELDRRDPERVRMRMVDRFDLDCVREVLSRLDELRGDFITSLRAADPALLQTRPQPDEWSPVETLRHLVFAEDLYTNRWLLRNDEPWCRLGQRPAFLDGQPGYEEVGSQPAGDLETILAAWASIHARLKDFVACLSPEDLRRETRDIDFGQGTVAGILQGLAQHDLVHIRQVEAAINRV